MGDVARIERLGGHPALDFVNTLGGLRDKPDDEYLFGYSDLVIFAEGSGLLSPLMSAQLRRADESQPDMGRDTFNRALQLRDCLDQALRAHIAHRHSDPDLEIVLQAYLTALSHASLKASGSNYDFCWYDTSVAFDQPLWSLAVEAVNLLRAAPLHRLRGCGRCRWMFLDTSRNRSRRWCSMNACGSIVKMRRYRAARRL